MTATQRRLLALALTLPDPEDRAAALAGANAIATLREVAVQTAGWDDLVIRLQQAPSPSAVPLGDY